MLSDDLPQPPSPAPSLLARRMTSLTGSTIRQMLEVATRPGMISFAGGLPPVEAFDLEGIRTAVIEALQRHPADCLQYGTTSGARSEEHTSELQSLRHLVCRLLLEK